MKRYEEPTSYREPTRVEKSHELFFTWLGPGKMRGRHAYSDGGGTDRGRAERRRKGAAAKQARKRQRRTR